MYKRRERPYQKIKNDTRTLVLAGDQKSIIILNRNFLNLGIIESRNYIRISYGSFLYAGTNGISPFS